MRAHGVAVWSNAVDHTHDDVPAPSERFVEQLQAEAPIVDSGTAFTTFEWCYYFSPNSGARQKALYDGYARYLNSTRGREYSLKSEYERGRLDRTHERRLCGPSHETDIRLMRRSASSVDRVIRTHVLRTMKARGWSDKQVL